MWTRRGVLLGAVTAGAGAVRPAAANGADLPPLDSRFTFASMPDLFNGDVGDLPDCPPGTAG